MRKLFILASVGAITAGCTWGYDEGDQDVLQSSENIIGGTVPAPRSWPNVVSLSVEFVDPSGAVFETADCAATVIHPRRLLTAAHCMYRDALTPKIKMVTNVDSLFDPAATAVALTGHTITFPPNIDHSAFPPDPDLAIITLSAAQVLKNRRTVGLVAPAVDPTIQVGNPTLAVGWGATNSMGMVDGSIRQVGLSFLGLGNACNSLTGWSDVRPNEFCAGFIDVYKGICEGDSGGPGLLRIDGAWNELGIASTAPTNCNVADRPGIFAHIPSHYSWIMGNLPTTEARVSLTKTSESAGEIVTSGDVGITSLPSKWDVVVPGNFSTLDANSQGLLTYSRSRKELKIYKITNSTSLTLVRTHSNLPATWTNIVPGQFDATAQTDFFAYDAAAQTGAFYIVDSSGNITLRNTVTNPGQLLKVWRIMVPGKFNGDSLTDLFFYDPKSGAARVCTTTAAGALTEATVRTYAKNWEVIVPGEFNGDTTYTDLAFYNPAEGRLRVQGTAMTAGVINPGAKVLLETTTFGKNWQYLAAGQFGGTSLTDFVAYDPLVGPTALPGGGPNNTRGTLKFYKTVETLAAGAVASVAVQASTAYAWRQVWMKLVTYPRTTGSTRFDVLAYDPFSDNNTYP